MPPQGEEEVPVSMLTTVDERVRWIMDKVAVSFCASNKDIAKFKAKEEFTEYTAQFLDSDKCKRLFVWQVTTKEFAVSPDPPSNLSRKGIFFYKTQKGKIMMPNIADSVIFGEIDRDALDSFHLVTNTYFMPALSQSRNSTKEFIQEMNRFLSGVTITMGQIEGKTVLPMPNKFMAERDDMGEKDRIHALETAVVQWTAQIRDVLKRDPEVLFMPSSASPPGPLDEIKFWRSKSDNLDLIHEQLLSEEVRGIMFELENTNSSYLDSFKKVQDDVNLAREESSSNHRFLRPLKPIVKAIRSSNGPDEFDDLNSLFLKLFHAIYLIWTRSSFYNTTGRLVVLIRESCNDLVEVCRSFVSAKEILHIEPLEAVDKLRNVLTTSGAFKRAYFTYKNKVNKFHPANPWRIQLAALFHRLDQFLERVRDVLELVTLGITFSKLSSIKIGGTKGSQLSREIRIIYDDFKTVHEHFREVAYDMLDIEQTQFEDDFRSFREVIKEKERRIGSIMGKGFDETSTIEASVHLIESFNGFTDREVVQRELEKKELEIIQHYTDELKQVQFIFHQQKDNPPIFSNMPPTAGALMWSNALLERLTMPLQQIRDVNELLLRTVEGNTIQILFDSISDAVHRYQRAEFEKWKTTVPVIYKEKLNQYLLKRDAKGLLCVNFDPQLVRILREVNYVNKINSLLPEDEQFALPEESKLLFQQMEQLQSQTNNLKTIRNHYNKTVSSLIDVERPLLEKQLKNIDRELGAGLNKLTWESADRDTFIEHVMALMMEASNILSTLKFNVDHVSKMLSNWRDKPLFEYNEGRALSLKDFMAKYEELKKSRSAMIRTEAQTIHEKLENSFSVLQDISKSDPNWINYVNYVNSVVVEGLCQFAITSMEILRNQIDSQYVKRTEDATALLEFKLHLEQDEENLTYTAEFNPSVISDGSDMSLKSLVHSWIDDFIKVSTLVPRLDMPEEDYFENIKKDGRISQLKIEIDENLSQTNTECEAFKQPFSEFSFLYEIDPDQAFNNWIEENKELEKADIETYLAEYRKQVHKYEDIESKLVGLPTCNSKDGWIRIDSRPMKLSLKDNCVRWKKIFTNHLLRKVEDTLSELFVFMNTAQSGLEKKVEDGDVDTLKEVMGYIRSVKTRVESAGSNQGSDNKNIDSASKHMFEPLHAIINFLNQHECEVTATTLDHLEKAPDTWKALYQKALDKRENLSNLQDKEANNIKSQILAFNDRIQQFQIDFANSPAFHWSSGVARAYPSIDAWYLKIVSMQTEADELYHLQELFDLVPMEYKELKACMEDVKLSKQLWDTTMHVQTQVRDWMKTPFYKADVSFFLDETKKLLKTLNTFPMKMKSWDSFSGLSTNLENLKTSLPLILSLRDPAMRPRHWQNLVKETHQQGTIDPEDQTFNLQQFIDLKLHAYEDTVLGIVEKSTRELGIENQLVKIENIWESMELEYVEHGDLKCAQLGSVEEIVENLEDNQVKLQNLAGNRFVKFFSDRVSKWQTVLGTIESVILLWVEVQNTWQNLYPIFVLSEDIKIQLPEDAKRFEDVDDVWRELMEVAKDVTNVVEACFESTIQERLKTDKNLSVLLTELQDKLEMCEKSLAEYLEKKRKAFPRFYFVAPADLVDILSKGSFPHLVMSHMPKLVDAISTLTFDGDSNLAVGLVSTDDETIDFTKPYKCEGAVEHWLNGLLDNIRDTLSTILNDAHQAYMETTRDLWIKQFPAQLVIVASRIYFTSDVNSAFDRYEEGNKNALKDYSKNQIQQLAALTQMVQTDLDKGLRKKIITLITVDVHNRDIVLKLIDEKAETASVFTWQSQLRYTLDDNRGCTIDIADASFSYNYEYIGNNGCLVITPLTDRCYITLTQSLRLIMGGAPAGPAGTGKTETTKDLGRALGTAVYVFNCSDQMDTSTLGDIFKGLVMTGTWGCFDEFNRVRVGVLSVVATQFKSILDAIRAKKEVFNFQGEEITLVPTIGAFITMNPGYKGRTELPENLKALFRPCAMIVPDLLNICEIMLASEGFIEAKALAKKFVTLYKLNRELLSKQDHYDWGLRAIKSVLVIAGGLKRAEPQISEEKILMRALRDTNLAKLSYDDVKIFLRLIGDLFPGLDIDAKHDQVLEKAVKQAVRDQNLQNGENDIFVKKVIQFKELLDVRHSVFVLGPAGSSKTCVWKTLQGAMDILADNDPKKKTIVHVFDPKVPTSFELYGYLHQQTREWKDGVLSYTMRELSKNKNRDQWKWIVLDGDIDTEWIESMNTVMDDNKVLTLASNERIPLTSSMRMVFEISHLRNASPATVSRAGILFINENDVGWVPFKESWIASREDSKEQQTLERLFDSYVPRILDHMHSDQQKIIDISDMSLINALCNLLDGLITEETCPPGKTENVVYEMYFIFACVWAFGGSLSGESHGAMNQRDKFSTYWRRNFTNVKFPEGGTVFDYYIDSNDRQLKSWDQLIEPYEHDPELEFNEISVSTSETTQISYIMDTLMKNQKPVLLVGTAGTGKTSLAKAKLQSLPEDDIIYMTINFNSMTDSMTLQAIMEQSIEKKAGRRYGPPGRKKLVYFVDDLNMPNPDKYDTQSAICLIRQHMDHGFWYDRAKMTQKDVSDVQYLAAMNPKSGSFTVDARLQRHFFVMSSNFPAAVDLTRIYGQIFSAHLAPFEQSVRIICDQVVKASIALQRDISSTFLPNAIKFIYNFNLREISNLFQGLCLSRKEYYTTPVDMIRLWFHECYRVFSDRMINEEDVAEFTKRIHKIAEENYEGMKSDQILPDDEPLLFTSFMDPPTLPGINHTGEPVYLQSPYSRIREFLGRKLEEYNSENSVMNLVLFTQAVEHICRIARIIFNPRGSALLVGVGGSGKQSLARIASYIIGYETYQITVTSSYSMNDFKTALMALYKKCGLKGERYSFILADGQIVHEKMLVYINDLLSSGYIPELFAPDEKEQIIQSMTNEVKNIGKDHTNQTVIWEYFLGKVRNNLHVILCFSPVAPQFRTWCRKGFPALATCTVIDWFHKWPHEALISVASRFLDADSLGGDEIKEKIAQHMAFVHGSVEDASNQYKVIERRHNYVTPKSFLELIELYKSLLQQKRDALYDTIERLNVGLYKLRESSEKVQDLQVKLKNEQVIVKQKKDSVEVLLKDVSRDQNVVEEQTAIAHVEEEKTNKIVSEVEAFAAECAADLSKAEPVLEEAMAALNTLNIDDIRLLKSLGSPPPDIAMVTAAVMILTSTRGIPKDVSWLAAKNNLMKSPKQMIESLVNFDKEHIPQANVDVLKKSYLSDDRFDPEQIVTKSSAAAGLCKWVINIVKFHEIHCDVEPKRERLREAEDRLAASKATLKKCQDRVKDLTNKLNQLLERYTAAQNEKAEIEDRARKTEEKLELAERLVHGLADENVRWAESIEQLQRRDKTFVGDVLVAAAFLSYVGAFTKNYRESLIKEKWIPDLQSKEVPMSQDIDVLYGVLTDEAEVAQWNNESLPADRISTENGCIVSNCKRWPLLIDPQLQGIKWIKNKESKNNLQVVQLTQRKYLDVIENAIFNGYPVVIENIQESIDSMLDPILTRSFTRRGRTDYIKLGDKEIEYHPNFRLYLQTKLSNPHYRPEIVAQTTMVTFNVTSEGLEDQLLAVVVNKERPDLEEQRVSLLRRMNQYKIDLKRCEDGLLHELSNAQGDILENKALIENLENTKIKAREIAASVKETILTTEKIEKNRQVYRSVAVRGSLLYFLIDQLSVIDHMYQYSLEAFMVVFNKALDKATNAEKIEERVDNIIDSITDTLFRYVTRGLFARHKLIFSTMLCFGILQRENAINAQHLDFLLRAPKKFSEHEADKMPDVVKDWCNDATWAMILALGDVEGTTPSFDSLKNDMINSYRRWKEWCEFEQPEDKPLPLEWKNLSSFEKLLIVRCLRPDRIIMAMEKFVSETIGSKYVTDVPVDLQVSLADSGPTTPIFFILSPGVDPLKSVEAMGEKYGFTDANGKFMNISLGQGQEFVAEKALEYCFLHGGWVMLNNLHLTPEWLGSLEKKLDHYAETFSQQEMRLLKNRRALPTSPKESDGEAPEDVKEESIDGDEAEQNSDSEEAKHSTHQTSDGSEPNDGTDAAEEEQPQEKTDQTLSLSDDVTDIDTDDTDDANMKIGNPNFRVFLSAEPSQNIPLGILQRSIKLTNEPPSGLRANLVRGFMQFDENVWESSSKQTEFKSILFALCFFHAVLVERKKFGPQGWNINYPFNLGDLTTCIAVLGNYLEDRPKVPWEDLRYVFGEIMYGGHITDDWDRRLCMTYLHKFVEPRIVETIALFPGFQSPPTNLSYTQYLEYIELHLLQETPAAFGLDANAEIDFRTVQGENLFSTIVDMQPRTVVLGEGKSDIELVRELIAEFLEKLPDMYNLEELGERLDEDRTPYQNSFLQECEYMNALLLEMRRSLEELDKGVTGELTMTDKMSELQHALLQNKVSDQWNIIAYPSIRALDSWFKDLLVRNEQLAAWTQDLQVPKCVWISGFFNPQSFLTAILQTTARAKGWPLDKMMLVADVTKRENPEEVDAAPREGAFAYGMYLEGAAWDSKKGNLATSTKLMDLYPKMPIMHLKGVLVDKHEATGASQNAYNTPIYKTVERGPTFVTSLALKTRELSASFVLAGAALILDVNN